MNTASVNSKSTLFINKNILNRDTIFKRLDVQNEYSCQQKAKDSQLYKQLERKVQFTQKQHKHFIHTIDQRIARIEEQIKLEKSSIHQKKIDLWELKNEVMQLNEAIKQDEQENQQYYQQQQGQDGQEQEEANQEQIDVHNEGHVNQYINSNYSEQEQQSNGPKDLNDLLQRWGIKKQSNASMIQNQY